MSSYAFWTTNTGYRWYNVTSKKALTGNGAQNWTLATSIQRTHAPLPKTQSVVNVLRESTWYRRYFQNVPRITLFLRNIKNTINSATFPLKYSLCANIHVFQQLRICWKYFWKPFSQDIFSSFVAFLIMSVESQKLLLWNADFSRQNI